MEFEGWSDREFYAYAAGAIDSDGFITISRSKKKKKSDSYRYYYSAKVGFTGTRGRALQDELKKRFGGSVYTHTPKNKKHKPWNVYNAGEKVAEAICKAILPFLVMKRENAKVLISYRKLREKQKEAMISKQKPPYRVTDEMNYDRDAFWQEMTRLNKPYNRKRHLKPLSKNDLAA